MWHAGLIFKVKSYGVEGELLLLFKNYLQNRKQKAVLPWWSLLRRSLSALFFKCSRSNSHRQAHNAGPFNTI